MQRMSSTSSWQQAHPPKQLALPNKTSCGAALQRNTKIAHGWRGGFTNTGFSTEQVINTTTRESLHYVHGWKSTTSNAQTSNELNCYGPSAPCPLSFWLLEHQHSVLWCANSRLRYSTHVDTLLNVLGLLSAYQPLSICVELRSCLQRGGVLHVALQNNPPVLWPWFGDWSTFNKVRTITVICDTWW